MKTHHLTPNTPEWLAYRRTMLNASDAPAMLSCSPYKTRSALLRELHTGVTAEADPALQRLYDAGHRFEALAKPLAETIVGEELDAIVGSDGRYSATFDGITLMQDVVWEHKTLNDKLLAILPPVGVGSPDVGAALPPLYRVQMEQQCMVSGAGRALFTASKWTADGELIEARHCWYEPDAELRAEIMNGWDRFASDLAAYTPPATAEPAPIGKTPDTLPALRIEVTGAVTASNLAEFKATAMTAIRGVNRDLRTDADFADAEKAVKWCGEVESRLKAAKEHALSQTADIDALFKALDDIGAEARTVRLDLDKLVKRRKDEVREHAVTAVRKALDEHIAALNAELAPMRLQPAQVDFGGAIKGLRSIESMQDALDTALANAKIAADAQARLIRANVATFAAQADGVQFLFADLGQIVHKAPDDFVATLHARIAHHRIAEQARESARKKAEDERIAAEARRLAAQQAEDARVAALAEQRRQDAAAESARAAAAMNTHRQDSQHVLKAEAARPDATAREQPANASPVGGPMGAGQAAAAAPAVATPRADEPATLKLGTICERLGFTMTAAFVADTLRVPPARTDGRSVLYRESDFRTIGAALIDHIASVVERSAELADG